MGANLKWNKGTDFMITKCNQRLYLLHLKRSGVPAKDVVTLYKAIAIGQSSSTRSCCGTAPCRTISPGTWSTFRGFRTEMVLTVQI